MGGVGGAGCGRKGRRVEESWRRHEEQIRGHLGMNTDERSWPRSCLSFPICNMRGSPHPWVLGTKTAMGSQPRGDQTRRESPLKKLIKDREWPYLN